MKRNYYMPLNKGFSIIEGLVSIIIVSIIFIGVISFNYFYQYNSYNNEKKLKDNIMIQNVYDVFSEDPSNFKNNILEYFDGRWNNDKFEFTDNKSYYLLWIMTERDIELVVVQNDKELEAWHRYRN